MQVTNEPKRQACGAPDYILARKNIPFGYIEAKDIGVDLNKVERGGKDDTQWQRYSQSLDNLILTDYLEFRFFRNSAKVETVTIAERSGNTIRPLPENYAKFATLLKDFGLFQGQTIKSARKLAEMMAHKAALMRDVFYKAVQADGDSTLKQQLAAFIVSGLHEIAQAISNSGNGWLELLLLPALGFLGATIISHALNINSAAFERHKSYQEKVFDLMLEELGQAITQGVQHANLTSAAARKPIEVVIQASERNLRIYSHIIYKGMRSDNNAVKLCKQRVENKYAEFYRQLTGGNFNGSASGSEPNRAADIALIGSGLRADLLKLRNEELICATSPMRFWHCIVGFFKERLNLRSWFKNSH